jgi:hypothetical protein
MKSSFSLLNNKEVIKNPLVISLGVDCSIKVLLKKQNIEQPTFPFDWFVSYKGVTDLISNNLQKSKLIDGKNLDTYIDKKNGILFKHDNKIDIYEKYTRRLNRLNKYLEYYEKTNNKIIFMRKSHDKLQHSEDYETKYNGVIKNDIEDMNNLSKYLSKTYPKLNYIIHLFLMCNRCYSNYNKETYNKNINIKKLKIYNLTNLEDKEHENEFNLFIYKNFLDKIKNIYDKNSKKNMKSKKKYIKKTKKNINI